MTIHKGPKTFQTTTMEGMRSILYHLRGCGKHNFGKKATSPVKKRFWPHFSGNIECDKPQLTNFEGPQDILTIIVEIIR